MEVEEALNEQTAAPIENLVDDCLLSIFDYLPERDLDSLTLVSKRFNRIAKEVRLQKGEVELQRFSWLFLKKFGSSIRSLKLNFNVYAEAIEEICKFCPNVTALTCSALYTEAFLNPFFIQMLSQLTKLAIIRLVPSYADCHIEGALSGCGELTKLSLGQNLPLKITHHSNFEPFFCVQFPKLREFKLRLLNSLSNDLLGSFCQMNTTIKVHLIEGGDGNQSDDESDDSDIGEEEEEENEEIDSTDGDDEMNY